MMFLRLFLSVVVLWAALPAQAKEYTSGTTFHHEYWFTFECEGAEIYRVKKEWYSSGGVISKVSNAGSNVVATSIEQNGLIEYDVSFFPEAGEEVTTALNFDTNEGTEGSVTSIVTIFWKSDRCGERQVTNTSRSTVVR